VQGAGVGGRFDLKKKTGEWMCSFDTDAWILSKISMPAARNVIFFARTDWEYKKTDREIQKIFPYQYTDRFSSTRKLIFARQFTIMSDDSSVTGKLMSVAHMGDGNYCEPLGEIYFIVSTQPSK